MSWKWLVCQNSYKTNLQIQILELKLQYFLECRLKKQTILESATFLT